MTGTPAGATPIRPRDLARLRLAAQRLVGRRCDSPADAVRWMACLQGQDLLGVLESVALRSLGADGRPATLAGVRSALADGSVVRSWPMRGTLHLAPGEDMGWMVRLAAGRSRTTHLTRMARLGIDSDEIGRARDLLLAEVAGSAVRTREQIRARWADEGIAVGGGRDYHLLYLFVVDGLVAQADGDVDGAVSHGFVHLDRWLAAHGRTPRTPTREEAVAEWLERYLRSHGPAPVTEFRRWTGLPLRDIRPALDVIADRLEAVSVEGETHWMDPVTPDLLAEAGRSADAVLLLPGFDEYLLGYGDRSHALAAGFADRIVPGGNGVFRRTVVHRGRVVGTWKTAGTGARRRIDVEPFAPLNGVQTTGVARAFRRHPA